MPWREVGHGKWVNVPADASEGLAPPTVDSAAAPAKAMPKKVVRRSTYKKGKEAGRRAVFGTGGDDTAADLNETSKTEAQRERIQATLEMVDIFSGLSAALRDRLVKVMKFEEYTAGSVVYMNGDEGSKFFLVDSGEFVAAQESLQCFGQEALLYPCERDETISCAADGALWYVDRATYQRILKDGNQSRTLELQQLVGTVALFQSLSREERSKLVAALEVRVYEKDNVIIQQGDVGDAFFLIQSGNVVVVKDDKEVAHLGKGAYFGERALLNDEPRAWWRAATWSARASTASPSTAYSGRSRTSW